MSVAAATPISKPVGQDPVAGQVRFLSQNRPGPRMGMGHYERLLLHHLLRESQGEPWSFEVVFDGRSRGQELDPQALEPGLRSARFSGFSTCRLTQAPEWIARAAAHWGNGRPRPSLYHSLALSSPAPRNAPALITIHDLPPARFDDEGTVPRWARAVAQSAWGIVTPSAWAKGELVELLGVDPARVHVVLNGCEHDRFHRDVAPADESLLRRLGLQRPFLAYSGGFTRRKNVAALLEAWKKVAPDFPELTLALLGPAEPLGRLAAAANAPRVQVAGYLNRDEMPRVLKAAEALVCPSVYEGFGLPPLEAMALGVPIVAVRATAVPEVTAGNAVWAENGSATSLADALQHFLRDPEAAEPLRQAGLRRAQDFHWPEHARQVLDLYRRALSEAA